MASKAERSTADTVLRSARAGSADARGELVRLSRPDLSMFLRREVGARLARTVSLHDLEQDAFLSALDALSRLEGIDCYEDFRRLLFRHARWRIFKETRRHRHFAGESALSAPLDGRGPRGDLSGATGEVTRGDRTEWLAANVDRLAEGSAEVVRMRLMGMDFAEIARELGRTEGAVRRRYLRALNELRVLLREPGS